MMLRLAFFLMFSHFVTVTWDDAINPAGTTYTVYRGDAPCASAPAFSALQSGIQQRVYVDTAVVGGASYCYYTTAVYGGLESVPSNLADGNVPPDAGGMTFTGVSISGPAIMRD